MDFAFDSDQEMLRETIKKVVADYAIPHRNEWENHRLVGRGVLDELGGLGLLGLTLGSAWEGADLGATSATLVVEELSRGDPALGHLVATHLFLSGPFIEQCSTPEQKNALLSSMARGDRLVGWICRLLQKQPKDSKDSVLARHDRGGWVLNGADSCTAVHDLTDHFVVFGHSEDASNGDPTTAFLVEASATGLGREPIDSALGLLAAQPTRLTFDNTPAEPLEKSRQGAPWLFGHTCMACAAVAVGLGQAAIDEASGYASERKQFGKSIADFQAIQWKLADMASAVEAARLLLYRAACSCETGKPCAHEAAMAAREGIRAATVAADFAVQVHGGYGYTADFWVERLYRDAAALAPVGISERQIRSELASHTLAAPF